jgi:hypothetical protein
VGQLNFELCGNAYYDSPNSGTYELAAQIYIADCDQFFDYTGPTPSGVIWNTVLAGGIEFVGMSGVKTVCFKFTGTYNITEGCRYHAAVGLGVQTDYTGGDKDTFDLNFSYQLKVSQ